MLLGIGTLAAQNSNRLYIPDLTALPGSTLSVPVYVENTTEIVAVQFTLKVPEGSALTSESAILTNRAADHTVTLREMDSQEYLCVIYSSTNSPIKGRTGKLMTVDMQVGNDYEEGSTIALALKDVVLSLRDGSNVLSSAEAGTISLVKRPDLCITNVKVDKTDCAPGEALSVSWQVQNVGGVETGDGWTEQISLVQSDGTSVLLGTAHYDETLSASGSVSRQATVTLSGVLGLDGHSKVQVQLIPHANTGESEGARSNNTATTETAVNISKLLMLTLPTGSIAETNTQPIRCSLVRSGNRAQEQTFTLTATADSRLIIPQEVTIPAGQSAASFYIQIKDNTTLDDGGVITITASGSGYEAVSKQLTIEDNEYPDLTLTASKTEVTEGDSFQLTITASRTSASPIEVTLTSENSKRFSFPSKVTIPAGETSAEVTVQAVDDELPSLDLTNSFTASAPGYNTSEVLVILKDNDLPVLELTLTPTTVSEGAGVVAVAGVLKRTTNTNNKITVKLTDDAEGGLYFANRTLELAKGVEEVHFNFGPVDNALVDGDCTYTITAAVWLSSCNCGTSGESAGYVTAQLQVLDNDGAALNLTSSQSTVKEGGKTTLTISRNTTDNVEPLAVILQSDYDENLTYNHTVTIPAGQTSTTIEVTSNGNDVQGDNHTVVFTAQAEGYATGTCYLMVTDQTLPDARISSITSDAIEAEVGAKATLNIVVTNDGAADLPAEVPVKIYRRGDSNAVGTIYTSEAMPVGSSQTLTKTITLPTSVGTHNYYAVVNESNKIQELTYNNNTSSDVTIATLAPYSVAVSTDKSIYNQGEKVIITGQLSGNGTANTAVDIYLINEGARQVQSVTTDAHGFFTYEWQLYALQCGHFIAGACYPGEGAKEEMAVFDVYGLKRTSSEYVTCDVINGDTYKGILNLVNPGILDLTGVKVEVVSAPENCIAEVSVPAFIAGGQTIGLSYQLHGTAPSEGKNWEEVTVRVTADEGVSLDVILYFYCRNAKGKIMPSTNSIVTTMTKDKTREYSLQITNTGRGNTGTITLALPGFIKSLSGNTLPALEQNGTIDIPLAITPTDEMQLNVPVTGQMGINCENGEGAAIAFRLTPVSEETGILLVDVCDENTYYTNEAPHMAGAQVIVQNPVTNEFITQGLTDSNGLFSVILPEGYYKLNVTADKHESYTNNIYVDPGIETRWVVNLSIEAIKVNWDVKETEVEDEYEIVTTVSYETNVPMPVVVVDVPESIPADSLAIGESLIFYAVATNKGLIAANGFTLEMPEDVEHLIFEPLAPNQDLTLSANESIVIPIRVTRKAIGNEVKEMVRSKIDVLNIIRCIASLLPRYYWDCGPDRKWHRYKTSFKIGKCKPGESNITTPSPPPVIPIIPIIPDGGGGSYGGSWSNDTIRTMKYEGCEPCQNRTLLTLLDCGLKLIPVYRALSAVVGCGISVMETTEVLFDKNATAANRLGAVLGTLLACEEAVASAKGEPMSATRKQQIDAAIGKIVRLLGDITSKVGQEDWEGLTDWDNIVDMLGDLGSIAGDLADLVYDDLEELLCVPKLLRPCDYTDDDLYNENDHHNGGTGGGGGRVQRLREHTSYPDYLIGYRKAVSYGAVDILARIGIKKAFFGDIGWTECDSEQLNRFLQTFKVAQNENGIVEGDMLSELEAVLPDGMKAEAMHRLVERWNNTIQEADSDNKIDLDLVLDYQKLIFVVQERIHADGYSDLAECITVEHENVLDRLTEASHSVCATISLQLNQTMTLTRQAFRGTLTVFNGNEETAMQNVRLTLNVINGQTGKVATSHEFQINAESLEGFNGELDLGCGWTLGANETGTATILFIPTKYAAPTEPVEWSFGGTLSYIDPFTGLEVTRDLYPVTLTVKPSPELDLTYFMQRDVYGDDPLTEDVVEPMVPAEFSLLINNIGNGDATNVHMVTNQPKIIENEKGLLIDFEILSAQLNGGDKTLALGGSVASDFGTIPAHSQAYAQWWLTSSLLGHFTSYDVQATHVTSYDNPDLSLLNEVTIHELIRSIKVDDGEVTGFVVNDLADAEDTPDMLYFTDGTTAEVVVATSAAWQKQSNTEYVLTITPSQAGWNYGHVTDPTFGHSKLIGIRRQSDGKEINLRNFWQTDRTLRDGKDWLYENNLHFVDQMANSTETYLLTFEPRPDVELQVASFSGVPEEGVVLREPLQTVSVTFNKAIDAETFTREDITLSCQGTRLEDNIGITQVNDTQFNLDLSQLTAGNGYYVLTIQTADITDFEGFNGAAGKTATWIQFTEATTLALSFYDAEVTYGNSFTEPRILTNSPAVPTFTSTNPLVASVSTEGRVTINAVGTTQVNVALEETPMSDAAQTSYRLTVLQPEGSSEAPAGIKTVSITIPEGQTMTTFCSPWPIDFSDATNDCRAYMAFTYSEDIVECAEVVEAKGGAGLLIVGKPGTYTFPVRTSFYDPIENLFVGTLAPTYVEEMNDDKTNLGLKDIKFVPLNAGVIKANTAYLPIAMDDNVDAMTIVLKAMTGLRIITEQFDEVPWFNISGMKVSRPSAKGIYIHNGRKVVVQ